ncbi:DUF397 domain-containing protein [Amycolatopsis sp. NPDC049688]|uniref:DUF397 domain-containing protein n=1 Tax=Amycolatopsis sp. NPDC049688 TaxID=3154733 RepID=UPI00342AF378
MDKKIEPVATSRQDNWFKSSYSNATGSCVEVNFIRDSILIRDSKDQRPDSPNIGVGTAQWAAFLDVVQGK